MKTRGVSKSITAVVLVLMLFIAAKVPSLAAKKTDEHVVTVGYFSEPGMMNGAAEGENKSGFVYEYLSEISTHAGWTYSYVYGPFDELYERFINGEIDILPYLSKTPLRETQMLFPESGMVDETFYLASLEEMSVSGDYHELNGLRIGSVDGYFLNTVLNEFLETHGLDCEVVLYETPQGKWNGVVNSEVDVTIESSITVQDIDLDPIFRIGGDYPVYCAISKKRPDLLAEYNAAQLIIDTELPTLVAELKIKYFKGIPLLKTLSDKDVAWIKEHGVMHIGVFNNDAPLIYEDEEGNAKGIMADYLRLMFKNYGLDLPLEFTFFNGMEDALEALKAGDIDVIHPYYPSYNVAEKDGVVISSVVYSSPMGILYEGNFTSTTMNRIATPYTRLGAHYVEQNYPESVIVPCLNGYDCIDKMLAGEADCVVLNATALKKIAGTYNNDFNIKTLHTLCDTCFASLPNESAAVDIINIVAPFLSDAEVNAIEASYYVETDNRITLKQFLSKNPGILIGCTAFLMALIGIFVFVIIRRITDNRQRKALEEARNAAEAANSAKSTFLFNMSHDIRTPMNAILGFTDKALRNKENPVAVGESLEKVKISSEYLLRIINDILDMAKIESGKLEINEELHCFEKEGNALLNIFGAEAARKGIEFHTHFDVEDNYLWLDANRTSQVIANLISNAIKYTESGGEIWYSVEEKPCPKEGYARYVTTVKDSGRGMSAEFLGTIFDSFAREQVVIQSGVQGTGLGMAIVKRIVDAMGAKIDVQSEQGKGTTVTLTADHRIATPEEIEQYQAESDTAKKVREYSFAGRRMLLVEDNELNREIANDILEDQLIVVEQAVNGQEAVDIMRDKGPDYFDFILMDIQMPIMDGYKAAREIRKMYPDKRIPIVALSANAFTEDREASIAAGMDDHVAKPIKLDELFGALSKCL